MRALGSFVAVWLTAGIAYAQPAQEVVAAGDRAAPVDLTVDRVVFEPGRANPRMGAFVGYAGATPRVWVPVFADPADTPAPVLRGTTLYACAGAQLYYIDVIGQRVRRRVPLPGACRALAVVGHDVHLELEVGGAGDRTERVVTNERAPMRYAFPRTTYLFALHQRAQIAPGATLPTRRERQAALRDPANAAGVVNAGIELTRAEAVDPTNPWYPYELGMIALARGETEAAAACFGRALAKDRAYDLELLRMVTELDAHDPALADRAFARGYGHLVARGYMPAFATSALVAIALLGVPEGAPLDPRTHYDVLVRHARRLERLAPHAEGSGQLYEALRREAVRRGRTSDAARYAALASPSRRNAALGAGAWEAVHAGDLLNVLLGLFFATLTLTAFKLARTYGPLPDGASLLVRINPLTRFTRAERLGLVLAFAAFLAVGTFAARGIALVGQYASAPLGLAMGMPGDRETIAFTRAMTGSPGGDLVHATALLSAGDTTRALPFLARSGRPEARAMRAHVESGGPVRLVAPGLDALDEGFRTRVARTAPAEARNPLTAPFAVFTLAANTGGPSALSGIAALVFVLGVLALASLSAPTFPPPARPAAYVANLLLPGAPRAYGALSFLAGAAVATTALGLLSYVTTDGAATNVLDAIATPDVARFYGAAAPLPHDPRVLAFYAPGALVVVAHLVFVLFFARRTDDPARGRGSAAASSPTAETSSDAETAP